MTLRIQMLRYRGAFNQIVLPKKWAIDLIFLYLKLLYLDLFYLRNLSLKLQTRVCKK